MSFGPPGPGAVVHVWINNPAGFPILGVLTPVVGLVGVWLGNFLAGQRAKRAPASERERSVVLDRRERLVALQRLSVILDSSLLHCDRLASMTPPAPDARLVDALEIQKASEATSLPREDVDSVVAAAQSLDRLWIGHGALDDAVRASVARYPTACEALIATLASNEAQLETALRSVTSP